MTKEPKDPKQAKAGKALEKKRELMLKVEAEEKIRGIETVRAHLTQSGFELQKATEPINTIPQFCITQHNHALAFAEIVAGRELPEYVKVNVYLFRGGVFCTEQFGFKVKDGKMAPMGFVIYFVKGDAIYRWLFKKKKKEYHVITSGQDRYVYIPGKEFELV